MKPRQPRRVFPSFFFPDFSRRLCLLPPPPPVSDNELHDRLLKDKQRDGINQIGQCGSGTFSHGVFGKLQSKVNRASEHLRG